MKTKYFVNWKEACDYCASMNVSNEAVQYEPATNRYLVNLNESGRVVEE